MKKQIKAGDISLSPVLDRFSYQVRDGDETHLDSSEILVVYSKESGKYMVVSGRDIYLTGLDCGITSFSCRVIAEVDKDTEAILMRLSEVFRHHRPFHLMEEVYAVTQYTEYMRSLGGTQFYQNGGDRKSGCAQKQRIDDRLEDHFPAQGYRLSTFRRFGEKITLIGIEGLYYILMEKNQEVTIGHIHKKCGDKRLDNIQGDIAGMKGNGVADDEIKRKIGSLVYDILFEGQIFGDDPKGNSPEPLEDDEKDLSEADGADQDGEDAEPQLPPINPGLPPLNNQQLLPVRKRLFKVAWRTKKIKKYLKCRDSITAEEALEVQKEVDRLQDRFSEFITEWHRAATH